MKYSDRGSKYHGGPNIPLQALSYSTDIVYDYNNYWADSKTIGKDYYAQVATSLAPPGA